MPLNKKQRALRPDSPSLEHAGAVGTRSHTLCCRGESCIEQQGTPSVKWLHKDFSCDAEQAQKLVAVPPGNTSVKPRVIFASALRFCLVGDTRLAFAKWSTPGKSKPEGEQDIILQAEHETTKPGLFRHK